MKIQLYCDNVIGFKHACKLLENFDPLDFPPSGGVEVAVRISGKKRTYYFPKGKFDFLKEQTSLLDNVQVNIQGEPSEDAKEKS